MIHINHDSGEFKGSARELSLEFTHLVLGFKQTMIKDFGLSEDETFELISLCGKLAFMSAKERQQYLENLLEKE